jgi:small subunit ribosomal protein S17
MAKTLTGIVTSNSADKTIVVTVQAVKRHPLYKKQYTINTKFMAHDEKNEAEVGDKVSIVESRPLSARKRFVLEKIIQKPVLREKDTVGVIEATEDQQQEEDEEKQEAEA